MDMILNDKAELIYGKETAYTEMAIVAHQDDVEVGCPQGIVNCYNKPDKGLVAVIATDGRGSPRCGSYLNFSDEEMVKVRRVEQIEAAKVGDYSALALLNYTSKEVKDSKLDLFINDIKSLVTKFKPSVIYTHNLLDKHPTHIAVAKNTIAALRQLDKRLLPKKLYGCEVWRGLDWLCDDEKVVFDLSGFDQLLLDVLTPFKSQIEGGKRYDLASLGRRLANATFTRSHGVDCHQMSSYAMDLTPLIENPSIDIKEFALSAIDRFKAEILL